MAGLAGDGHGRGNAHEDEDGRHQEAAADAEQARDKADQRAQQNQERPVHRNLGDRQVNIHGTRLRLEGNAELRRKGD
ncbi:hypothetical protein D3C81_1729740 [compost metagenome]